MIQRNRHMASKLYGFEWMMGGLLALMCLLGFSGIITKQFTRPAKAVPPDCTSRK